jgi:hypothetical protein
MKDLMESFKPFGLSPMGQPPHFTKQPPVLYDARLGGWLGPWMMTSTNQAVVCRSYGLLGGTWGDKFSYKEYLNYGSWIKAEGVRFALAAAGVCLALPPVQWLLKNVLPPAGHGPSEDDLINGKLKMQIIADTDENEPRSGSIIISADADPAYLLSGKIFSEFVNLAMMVVESGLTLVKDVENTEVWKRFFGNGENQSVVVTPALLGNKLKERLERGGYHFALDV